MSWGPFSGALLLTGTEVLADTAAKSGLALGAYGGYAALAYELQMILNRDGNGLALTNALWNGMTNVTHTLIGVAVYGEELSARELIGILFVTAGIFLIDGR